MSRHLSDETILDRMLPYVMAVLSDDDAGAVVKSQALLTVTQLVGSQSQALQHEVTLTV